MHLKIKSIKIKMHIVIFIFAKSIFLKRYNKYLPPILSKSLFQIFISFNVLNK